MKHRITTLLFASLLAAGGNLLADRIPLEQGVTELEVSGSERINFEFQNHQADIEIIGHEVNLVRVEVDNGGHEDFPSYLDWDAGKRSLRLDLGHSHGNSKVRIRLPYNSSVNLQTVDSDIKVTGIRGDAIIRQVNGDIQLDGAAGAILIELVNGDTVVSPITSESNEPISIMSQNGNISLVAPKDFKGSATVSTIGGKVTCDVPGAGTKESSANRHVVNMGPMSRQTIPINGGGRPITLNTVHGNIEVKID